jgi:hypothetical protein
MYLMQGQRTAMREILASLEGVTSLCGKRALVNLKNSFILSLYFLLESSYTSWTSFMRVCSLLSPFSCRCVVRLAARSLDGGSSI